MISLHENCYLSENIRNRLIPTILEQTKNGERAYDIYSRLLKDNIVFIDGEIRDDMADDIVAELLYLTSVDSEKEISLYINSPGGSVSAGMAIIDTMRNIPNSVTTICIGMCASMGAYILSQGDKRYILPNAEVMIHQPLGGTQGQATDMKIACQHIEKTKEKLIKDLSDSTGQPIEKIRADVERDYWMDAQEALEYGIIDEIIEPKKKRKIVPKKIIKK